MVCADVLLAPTPPTVPSSLTSSVNVGDGMVVGLIPQQSAHSQEESNNNQRRAPRIADDGRVCCPNCGFGFHPAEAEMSPEQDDGQNSTTCDQPQQSAVPVVPLLGGGGGAPSGGGIGLFPSIVTTANATSELSDLILPKKFLLPVGKPRSSSPNPANDEARKEEAPSIPAAAESSKPITEEVSQDFSNQAQQCGIEDVQVNAAVVAAEEWHRKWTLQEETGHLNASVFEAEDETKEEAEKSAEEVVEERAQEPEVEEVFEEKEESEDGAPSEAASVMEIWFVRERSTTSIDSSTLDASAVDSKQEVREEVLCTPVSTEPQDHPYQGEVPNDTELICVESDDENSECSGAESMDCEVSAKEISALPANEGEAIITEDILSKADEMMREEIEETQDFVDDMSLAERSEMSQVEVFHVFDFDTFSDVTPEAVVVDCSIALFRDVLMGRANGARNPPPEDHLFPIEDDDFCLDDQETESSVSMSSTISVNDDLLLEDSPSFDIIDTSEATAPQVEDLPVPDYDQNMETALEEPAQQAAGQVTLASGDNDGDSLAEEEQFQVDDLDNQEMPLAMEGISYSKPAPPPKVAVRRPMAVRVARPPQLFPRRSLSGSSIQEDAPNATSDDEVAEMAMDLQSPQPPAVSVSPLTDLSASIGSGKESTAPPERLSDPTPVPVLEEDESVKISQNDQMDVCEEGSVKMAAKEVIDSLGSVMGLAPSADEQSVSPSFCSDLKDEISESLSVAGNSTVQEPEQAEEIEVTLQEARDGLLLALAAKAGDTKDNGKFDECLDLLCDHYQSLEQDTRQWVMGREEENDHLNAAGDPNNAENDPSCGTWLTLTKPTFFANLGDNDVGDPMYTLGRMAFDMFTPTDLVVSLQGNFNIVGAVSDEERQALFEKVVDGSNNSEAFVVVPKSLQEEVQSGESVLRTYNIVAAFTIEPNSASWPKAPNKDVHRPIRGVMTTFGYMLPDPDEPNRHSVWITGGRLEPNNDPRDQADWKRLFTLHPPEKQQLGLGQKAKLLAAKLLMGAIMPQGMNQEDGSMEYTFSRPLGGHGMAFVETLYVDESLRIVRGHRGTTFVFSKLNQN